MRMLDLFCGRLGWGRAFAARGWDVVGIDLTMPGPEFIPEGVTIIQRDILTIDAEWVRRNRFDFICASSPCEQFSLFGLPHFHPNPLYPGMGIKLFNHTRELAEKSGRPYVMENVKPSQNFVGRAANHCGPFYLWGNAVPPLLPQGITKGVKMGSGSAIKGMTKEQKCAYRKKFECLQVGGKSRARAAFTSQWATIPPELASCVADYAERILEQAA